MKGIMSNLRRFLPSGFLLLMMTGCPLPDDGRSADRTGDDHSATSRPANDVERGLIVILPGIEGNGWQLGGMVAGLHDAGVDQAIEIVPWGTQPTAMLDNLTNLPANLDRASRIAERLVNYRRAHPRSSITLIGYSGGGGLAVLAVEALPADFVIDRLILIAAALAPDHDLTEARRHCRRTVNYYSELDLVFLGLGTKTFGTIDRVHADSAGRVGLRDRQGGLLAGDGLMQVAWERDWIQHGHFGGHLDWMSRAWARAVLAGQVARPCSESAPGAPLADLSPPALAK